MNTNTKRGFTLMELLVVIAIIGILASVVLASLNSARSKGSDAAVKSNLNNARAQAELFYDSNGNTYASVCVSGTNNISTMYNGANSANGGTTSDADCNSNATAWAAAAQLVSNTAQYYCVDSTGVSTTTVGTVGGSGATDFQAADMSC
jgi:prepilin-type N-terminal cleavage/methylation domain-containing protein